MPYVWKVKYIQKERPSKQIETGLFITNSTDLNEITRKMEQRDLIHGKDITDYIEITEAVYLGCATDLQNIDYPENRKYKYK